MKDNLNKNYAGIDLGTNSARLLIVNSQNEPILSESERVMIGKGMFFDNSFSNEAIDRTVDGFDLFAKLIKKHNVEKIRAVGTAACRTAKNVDILIDKIYKQTGINLEVISGNEEAYLTTLGASCVLKENYENSIFCDIGGGSTEFIFTKNFPKLEIIDSISIPFGGRNLSEVLGVKFFNKETISKINDLVEPKIKDFMERNDIKNKISKIGFVGISGAILRIASIVNDTKEYDREKAHGLLITKDKFEKFSSEYQNMDIKSLEKSPYLGEGRGPAFIATSTIFAKALDLSGAREVTASLSGIKEGVVKHMIDNHTKSIQFLNSPVFNIKSNNISR